MKSQLKATAFTWNEFPRSGCQGAEINLSAWLIVQANLAQSAASFAPRKAKVLGKRDCKHPGELVFLKIFDVEFVVSAAYSFPGLS